MYDWQRNTATNKTPVIGNRVVLNPAWSGYVFLKKEYGHRFPAIVNRVSPCSDGALVEVGTGRGALTFAAQCLHVEPRS